MNVNDEPINPDEVWIECEEGPWAVSNMGRMIFMSEHGWAKSRRCPGDLVVFRPQSWHGRMKSGNGYLMTTLLGYSGRKLPIVLHRYIAKYHIGSRPKKLTINHIDGNRFNNRADNLEYVSFGANIRQWALTVMVDPEPIRKLAASGMSIRGIARKLEHAWATVNRVLKSEGVYSSSRSIRSSCC